MKKVYFKNICVKLFVIFLLLVSCGEEASTMKEISIHIIFTGDKSYDKTQVDTNAKEFLKYLKSDKCSDTVFFPKIKLTRLGIKKNLTDSIVIKLSFINNIKKSVGTLAPNNLMLDYDEQIPKLKLPSFLFTDSDVKISQNEVIRKYEIDYKYSLVDSEDSFNEDIFYSTKSIIEDIKKEICVHKKSSFTILYDYKDESKTPPPILVGEPINPCKAENISKATDLRKEMIKIIDVSKSEKERQKLANNVWDKYFTNHAYVAKYINLSDKNPRYYGPLLGQGKIYFSERLARFESILDLNVISLEYSNKKGEEHKISGLHIVECHNKSKG